MNKKAIAILGAIFLLIMGTLGFLVYSKYSGDKNNTPPAQTTGTNIPSSTPVNTVSNNPNIPASTTPVAPNGAIKLADDLVVSPVLSFDGTGVTYFNTQGQLFRSVIATSSAQLQLTQKKQLSIQIKAGIAKILWPANGDDFIAQYTAADGKTAWSFFNHLTGVYTDLPPQISSLDWMPSGDKIIFIWTQDGKSELDQGNPDGTGWQKIADMWETDDVMHVSPDGQSILYYEGNSASTTNPIVQTTPDGKFWKTLVQTGYNQGVLWSPDSQKFLFGRKDLNTQGYQLWYYNISTGEMKNTGLNTMPSKAVWDKNSQTFYAAVPVSGIAGGNSITTDNFVKVDPSTLSQKQYPTGNASVDGRDLFLNLDNNKLFFRNAQDGGLYYIDLNQ